MRSIGWLALFVGRFLALVLATTAASALVGCRDESGKCRGAECPDAGDLDASDAQTPTDAEVDTGVDTGVDAGVPCANLPGLYAPGSCTTLASGVARFEPRYALWSDGAVKERFYYIPTGATIDATDPDQWIYPVGTTLWKHFSLNGMRIETRMLKKVSAGMGMAAWEMRTFLWNLQGTDVTEVTGGLVNAHGTTHDIPDTSTSAFPVGGDCAECHRTRDAALGFSAIQLNHEVQLPGDVAPYNRLAYLVASGTIVNAPAAYDTQAEYVAAAVIPGTTVEQEALGYMHANCGHCHLGQGGIGTFGNMRLFVPIGITDVTTTPTYIDTIDVNSGWMPTMPRVDATSVSGRTTNSAIYVRMSSLDPGTRMPRLATEYLDTVGLQTIATWIDSVP